MDAVQSLALASRGHAVEHTQAAPMGFLWESILRVVQLACDTDTLPSTLRGRAQALCEHRQAKRTGDAPANAGESGKPGF